MTLLVKKYGGTSVSTVERITRLAETIKASYLQGNKIVVVLSAMGSETDRLISLAHEITALPSPREYDVLVSAGEQVSIALMSIALENLGLKAAAYTGQQAGILTNSLHKKSSIISIDTNRLQADLEQGIIPVVAGFQGVNDRGDITTLGRGGSDTTAVSLAAALKADECQIYTDVKGVYTADPRVVPEARLLKHITFEEMLELASLGAKVLQVRAVEFASKYNVKLRVLPALLDDKTLLPDLLSEAEDDNNTALGTLISCEDLKMEQPLVSGIAFDSNQAQLTLSNLPNEPGIGYQIFDPIAKAGIVVDMIVQNTSGGHNSTANKVDISFTVPKDEYDEARSILEKIVSSLNLKTVDISGNKKVAKLSIVGVGMRSNMGVASRLFGVLGDEGINILLVTTSEIKVSVLIDERYLELGVRAVHAAEGLDLKE